jgi:hypothetical protein
MNPLIHTPLHPSFFNPLERYSEAEWEQLDPDRRSELETLYVLNNPVLREKTDKGLEAFYRGEFFEVTPQQLGIDLDE